jgi:hypothetical protein
MIRILYIAGDGRSGSTLLERLLGCHPALFPVGELKQIWSRSFLENQLCSCGSPFSTCSIWQQVREAMQAEGGVPDPRGVVALQQRVDRIRHLPRLLLTEHRGRDDPDATSLREVSSRLYRAIAEVTGASWIVDASKHPQTAYLLTDTPGIELHVLHLVRDPRGVAWSWQKQRVRPEITERTELMPRYNTWTSAGNWMLVNRLAELAGSRAVTYRRVCYEDLIARPAAALDELFTWLQLEPIATDIVSSGGEVELDRVHTVSGNPLRFRTGLTAIRNDDAWQRAMPPARQRLIRLLTSPLLHRYGY